MRFIIILFSLIIGQYVFAQNSSIDSALTNMVMSLDITRMQPERPKISCAATVITREPVIIINGILSDTGKLKELDPYDIESIDILKDVFATALYGCRGALSIVIIITTKSSKQREFIIKDFLDGNNISGATVTFISAGDKKDTLMFVADDKGVIITGKLKEGKEYIITVTSSGYKAFAGIVKNDNKKMKEFKLERDIVSCLPVVVVSYPPFTCSSIAGTFSRVSDCSLVYTKKAMEELPVLNQKETITAGIYPNPVQRGGTVTINVKVVRTEVVQIKIFSLDGKLVQSKSYTLIKGDNRIPVVADSRWGSGAYIVQVISSNNKLMHNSKLIIK